MLNTALWNRLAELRQKHKETDNRMKKAMLQWNIALIKTAIAKEIERRNIDRR